MEKDEFVNTITHLVGAVLGLAALVTVVVIASLSDDPLKIVSFSIYGATLVFLFTASTLYHSLHGKAKRVFRKLDHAGVFLLIAGTYTPFTLVTLRGTFGWTLFAIVWGLTVIGIVVDAVYGDKVKALSAVLYLAIGWLAVVAMKPFYEALGWGGVAWVAGGGALYTAGFAFLAARSMKRRHEIWHVFVLGGSACHFLGMLIYVL